MPRFVSPFASRPLAAWIEDLQQSQAPDDRYRALLAVNSLGTAQDAVRWCGHLLNDADSSVRALAAKQLGERKRASASAATADQDLSWTDIGAALVARLHDDDPDVRFEAARALGTINPQAPDALHVLWSLLDDDGTQPLMIAVVISALGERRDLKPADFVPRLRKLIAHSQAEVRENATAIVAKLGSDAAELTSELIVALEDEEPIVRENAAIALGQTGLKSADVMAALQTASQDEDEVVAAMAKTSIARLSE